jgi:hypothetical protein
MHTKLIIAAIIVLILVIYAVWYVKYRYHTQLVTVNDRGRLSLTCPGFSLVAATYRQFDGPVVDVKSALGPLLGTPKDTLLDAKQINQPPGGLFSIRYRCK